MKRVIRKGSFETNSSSMHSIIIRKEDEHYNTDELHRHIWVHESNDGKKTYRIFSRDDMFFERHPFKIIASFEGKVRFAIASICGLEPLNVAREKFLEINDIFKEVIPEAEDGVELPTETETAYKKQNGNVLMPWEVKYDRWENGHSVYVYNENGEKLDAIEDPDANWEIPEYGDIDHQSHGLLQELLNKEGIELKEFLTNKKYVVVIDGDEYDELGNLLEAKLIHMDDIQDIITAGGFSYFGDEDDAE